MVGLPVSADVEHSKILRYMGTKSGRDGDKAQALGLHTAYTENGTPYYNEFSRISKEQIQLQGLATCWVCNFDAALCKELFALPESEEPAVIIPLGYADDELKEKKRKDIDEIVK